MDLRRNAEGEDGAAHHLPRRQRQLPRRVDGRRRVAQSNRGAMRFGFGGHQRRPIRRRPERDMPVDDHILRRNFPLLLDLG